MTVNDVVLADWENKLYYAKIVSINHRKKKCRLLFDDGSSENVNFSNVHNVNETTTDIICVVCKEDSTTSCNEIVLCDSCSIGFHQKCHEPAIPADALEYDAPWHCSYCLNGTENPHIETNPFNSIGIDPKRRGIETVHSKQKSKQNNGQSLANSTKEVSIECLKRLDINRKADRSRKENPMKGSNSSIGYDGGRLSGNKHEEHYQSNRKKRPFSDGNSSRLQDSFEFQSDSSSTEKPVRGISKLEASAFLHSQSNGASEKIQCKQTAHSYSKKSSEGCSLSSTHGVSKTSPLAEIPERQPYKNVKSYGKIPKFQRKSSLREKMVKRYIPAQSPRFPSIKPKAIHSQNSDRNLREVTSQEDEMLNKLRVGSNSLRGLDPTKMAIVRTLDHSQSNDSRNVDDCESKLRPSNEEEELCLSRYSPDGSELYKDPSAKMETKNERETSGMYVEEKPSNAESCTTGKKFPSADVQDNEMVQDLSVPPNNGEICFISSNQTSVKMKEEAQKSAFSFVNGFSANKPGSLYQHRFELKINYKKLDIDVKNSVWHCRHSDASELSQKIEAASEEESSLIALASSNPPSCSARSLCTDKRVVVANKHEGMVLTSMRKKTHADSICGLNDNDIDDAAAGFEDLREVEMDYYGEDIEEESARDRNENEESITKVVTKGQHISFQQCEVLDSSYLDISKGAKNQNETRMKCEIGQESEANRAAEMHERLPSSEILDSEIIRISNCSNSCNSLVNEKNGHKRQFRQISRENANHVNSKLQKVEETDAVGRYFKVDGRSFSDLSLSIDGTVASQGNSLIKPNTGNENGERDKDSGFLRGSSCLDVMTGNNSFSRSRNGILLNNLIIGCDDDNNRSCGIRISDVFSLKKDFLNARKGKTSPEIGNAANIISERLQETIESQDSTPKDLPIKNSETTSCSMNKAEQLKLERITYTLCKDDASTCNKSIYVNEGNGFMTNGVVQRSSNEDFSEIKCPQSATSTQNSRVFSQDGLASTQDASVLSYVASVSSPGMLGSCQGALECLQNVSSETQISTLTSTEVASTLPQAASASFQQVLGSSHDCLQSASSSLQRRLACPFGPASVNPPSERPQVEVVDKKKGKRRKSKAASPGNVNYFDRISMDLPRHNWLIERLLSEKQLDSVNLLGEGRENENVTEVDNRPRKVRKKKHVSNKRKGGEGAYYKWKNEQETIDTCKNLRNVDSNSEMKANCHKYEDLKDNLTDSVNTSTEEGDFDHTVVVTELNTVKEPNFIGKETKKLIEENCLAKRDFWESKQMKRATKERFIAKENFSCLGKGAEITEEKNFAKGKVRESQEEGTESVKKEGVVRVRIKESKEEGAVFIQEEDVVKGNVRQSKEEETEYIQEQDVIIGNVKKSEKESAKSETEEDVVIGNVKKSEKERAKSETKEDVVIGNVRKSEKERATSNKESNKEEFINEKDISEQNASEVPDTVSKNANLIIKCTSENANLMITQTSSTASSRDYQCKKGHSGTEFHSGKPEKHMLSWESEASLPMTVSIPTACLNPSRAKLSSPEKKVFETDVNGNETTSVSETGIVSTNDEEKFQKRVNMKLEPSLHNEISNAKTSLTRISGEKSGMDESRNLPLDGKIEYFSKTSECEAKICKEDIVSSDCVYTLERVKYEKQDPADSLSCMSLGRKYMLHASNDFPMLAADSRIAETQIKGLQSDKMNAKNAVFLDNGNAEQIPKNFSVYSLKQRSIDEVAVANESEDMSRNSLNNALHFHGAVANQFKNFGRENVVQCRKRILKMEESIDQGRLNSNFKEGPGLSSERYGYPWHHSLVKTMPYRATFCSALRQNSLPELHSKAQLRQNAAREAIKNIVSPLEHERVPRFDEMRDLKILYEGAESLNETMLIKPPRYSVAFRRDNETVQNRYAMSFEGYHINQNAHQQMQNGHINNKSILPDRIGQNCIPSGMPKPGADYDTSQVNLKRDSAYRLQSEERSDAFHNKQMNSLSMDKKAAIILGIAEDQSISQETKDELLNYWRTARMQSMRNERNGEICESGHVYIDNGKSIYRDRSAAHLLLDKYLIQEKCQLPSKQPRLTKSPSNSGFSRYSEELSRRKTMQMRSIFGEKEQPRPEMLGKSHAYDFGVSPVSKNFERHCPAESHLNPAKRLGRDAFGKEQMSPFDTITDVVISDVANSADHIGKMKEHVEISPSLSTRHVSRESVSPQLSHAYQMHMFGCSKQKLEDAAKPQTTCCSNEAVRPTFLNVKRKLPDYGPYRMLKSSHRVLPIPGNTVSETADAVNINRVNHMPLFSCGPKEEERHPMPAFKHDSFKVPFQEQTIGRFHEFEFLKQIELQKPHDLARTQEIALQPEQHHHNDQLQEQKQIIEPQQLRMQQKKEPSYHQRPRATQKLDSDERLRKQSLQDQVQKLQRYEAFQRRVEQLQLEHQQQQKDKRSIDHIAMAKQQQLKEHPQQRSSQRHDQLMQKQFAIKEDARAARQFNMQLQQSRSSCKSHHDSVSIDSRTMASGHSPRFRSPAEQLGNIGMEKDKRNRCKSCGAMAKFLCSRCRNAWYCTERCQIQEWDVHGKLCREAGRK